MEARRSPKSTDPQFRCHVYRPTQNVAIVAHPDHDKTMLVERCWPAVERVGKLVHRRARGGLRTVSWSVPCQPPINSLRDRTTAVPWPALERAYRSQRLRFPPRIPRSCYRLVEGFVRDGATVMGGCSGSGGRRCRGPTFASAGRAVRTSRHRKRTGPHHPLTRRRRSRTGRPR